MITRDSLLEVLASTAAEGTAVDSAGAILAAGTAAPYGVVERSDDPDGYATVALLGHPAEIEVKLHTTAGSIVKGSLLMLHTNGTFKLDAATGARVVCAQALEAKAAEGQLLKARLLSTALVYAS